MTFYPNTKKRISVSKGGTKEVIKIKDSIIDKPSSDYSKFRSDILKKCDDVLKIEINNEERHNVIKIKNRIQLDT